MPLNFITADFPWYNIFAGTGLLAGIVLYRYNSKNIDDSIYRKEDVIIILAVSAFVGFGLSNVAGWFFYSGLFELSFLERIRAAGYTFYVGLLFFISISWCLMKLTGYRADVYFNEIIPSVTLFHAVSRVGCIAAGCCLGVEIHFYPVSNSIKHFPVREIEITFLLVQTILFQTKIFKNRFVIYLTLYSILRVVLEFFRGNDRGYLFTGIFSPTQELAVIILTAITLNYLLRIISNTQMKITT